MNLYLHYGVGHKPSKTRLNLTQSKTIKYNLQSRTGKHPKKRSCRRNNALPPPANPLQQPNTNPPNTTTHGNIGGNVVTTRRSTVSFSTVASSGRTGGRRRARLGARVDKKEAEHSRSGTKRMIKLRLPKSFHRRHKRQMLPLRLLSDVFSCQETKQATP
jgi:hypothetical protein